jgi:Flp pilus assembly protein TadD
MTFTRALVALLATLIFISFGATSSQRSQVADVPSSSFEKLEVAYRANNLGAALLDQYRTKEAVSSFSKALEIKPDLLIARINLSIALYYLPDAAGAKREAEKALAQDAYAPQPHYILGLIARAQNGADQAIAEFQKVLKIDPDDVATNINLGQLFTQQKKYPEARAAFRRALATEPYNETALYNLGLLLTRTGAKEEGQRLIKKFQQLRESGAGTTLGTNYLEGGRYAEAVVSTGAEPDLVDRKTPDVAFVDVTRDFLPSQSKPADRKPVASAISTFAQIDASGFNDEKRDELVGTLGGGVTLFDADGDGDLDLLDLSNDAKRLYLNIGGKFKDISEQCAALCEARGGINIGALAADYDNDGRADVLALRYGGQALALYHNDGAGRFSDVTKAAGFPIYPYLSISTAFVDIDHDGDLDIFVAGLADLGKPPVRDAEFKRSLMFPVGFAGAPNLLLRNNGNGMFTDITVAARVEGGRGHATAVVPTDYDNRRDVDLLVVNFGAPPTLYRNLRDGTFRDVAHETGLDGPVKQFRQFSPGNWDFTAAAVGDFNKDGFSDFFFLDSWMSGVFASSDGKGRFSLEDKTPWMFQVGATGNNAAQFFDYDNDGLLDLVRAMGDGVHVWRNLGNEWQKISRPGQVETGANAAPLWRADIRTSRALASGDLDKDGDIDLVLRSTKGELIIARNDGGNSNHSLAVNLHGRVSNKSAVEAKIEMRAGSLWQKLETYAASPAPAPADVTFGLGKRTAPDAVRAIWPAGIVQAETEFPALAGGHFLSLNLTELDRKPSSCPYLYTWNGGRFEFVTDFMGGGEMGYLEEPGRYNKPDPEEYVRIRGDQLQEQDGHYELRVTNELEEAMFVDKLQLLAIAHPAGTEVYPNEGMSDPPKPFKLFFTEGARPPLSAVDEHEHDVLVLVSRMDRRWPDDFKLERIRGYAAEHTLTMKLPGTARILRAGGLKSNVSRRLSSALDVAPASAQDARGPRPGPRAGPRGGHRTILLLTGWTDYAWSSDNVAAAQAGKAMKLPALQVKDGAGNWQTIIEDIGIPVGRPQTVVVDLTNKFLSAAREVRIVTSMRIYWDQILVDTSAGNAPMQLDRLDPLRADLNWRGFSAEVTSDGREPFGYDYRRVSFTSPWKVMTGHYTREGNVRELLLKSDDMFAICRPGDEISLSFNATNLLPLPRGWTRTFLLYADGFSKEMDINSASPDQIMPLPFHGMSRYPYQWPERYPLTEARRRYIEQYNTRVVSSPVARLETVMQRR